MHHHHRWAGPPWHPFMARKKHWRHGPPFGPHPMHPPGPPPWVMEWMGWRERPERGEVRYLVLDALASGPSHGYEIIQTIEQKTNGAYKPSPGSIYPTLQLLEEMGLITESDAEGKRKRFALTEEGKKELAAHSDDVEEAYARFSGPSAAPFDDFDFRGWSKRLKRVMRSVGRGARFGAVGPEKMEQIKTIIEDAIAKIEEVLESSER
ncbi:MAG: PadR family transcriptional regulator [Sandaracinaceae bacterium]